MKSNGINIVTRKSGTSINIDGSTVRYLTIAVVAVTAVAVLFVSGNTEGISGIIRVLAR